MRDSQLTPFHPQESATFPIELSSSQELEKVAVKTATLFKSLKNAAAPAGRGLDIRTTGSTYVHLCLLMS